MIRYISIMNTHVVIAKVLTSKGWEQLSGASCLSCVTYPEPLPVPTNTLYIDMLGPPILWLPAAPEKFPRSVYMFPRRRKNRARDRIPTRPIEKRRKNFLTLYSNSSVVTQERRALQGKEGTACVSPSLYPTF